MDVGRVQRKRTVLHYAGEGGSVEAVEAALGAGGRGKIDSQDEVGRREREGSRGVTFVSVCRCGWVIVSYVGFGVLRVCACACACVCVCVWVGGFESKRAFDSESVWCILFV